MSHISSKNQRGYVLLLVMLMFMGIGGVVLGGFTQEARNAVEKQRYEHNRRVLLEAKQALLQYAYDYPQFNARGPGRLPCPDTDDDGTAGDDILGPPYVTLAICESVGRFPWNHTNMNFYDARDASGERLWYAVSNQFYNPAFGPIVNSGSIGSITVQDQGGARAYDGAVAGIAAVIIAPGPATSRDEDNDVNSIYEYAQLRGTAAEQIDPRNYLEIFNGFDNSLFTNGESNTVDDGFMLGPVKETDPNSPAINTVVVNDQMVIITAEEVIAMAEKATLQAYQTAINDYLNVAAACVGEAPPGSGINEAICLANGGSWNGVYPWLYNYVGVPDIPGLSSNYATGSNFAAELATNLGNIGRIPSIFPAKFDDYFTEAGSLPVETELGVALTLTYPLTPTPVNSSASGPFEFSNAAVHDLNIQTANKLTNVSFVDIAGPDGRLTGTVVTPEPPFTHELYFWDEDETLPGPTGVWTLCPDDGDVISDCHRDGSQNPTPGGSNDSREEILRVILELDLSAAVNIDTNYTAAPVIGHDPADSTRHASITGTYNAANVILGSLPLTARYEVDRHYHAGDIFVVGEAGTLNLADLILGPMTLGLRYYPELPDWSFDDGWHDSIQMAYANDYRPDLNAAAGDCGANPPCLQINGFGGINNDKISILVLAGEHGWVDGDINPPVAADGAFANDVSDVFNLQNSILDGTFDMRTVQATAAPGDTELDKILVINR